MNQTFKNTLNGHEIVVDAALTGFTIYKKISTLIEYIAIKDDKLAIQFNKGNTVIYSGLPIDVIKAAVCAPSIGKFYHTSVKDKFDYEKIGDGGPAIVPSRLAIDDDYEDGFGEADFLLSDDDDDEY